MIKKPHLSLLFITLMLTGCQLTLNQPQPQLQPIPENILIGLAARTVIVDACYEADAYNVEQAVKYKEAIQFSLSTWVVETPTLNETVNKAKLQLPAFISQEGSLGKICKDWSLELEMLSNKTMDVKNQLAIDQQRIHEINKANASRPVTNSTSASDDNLIKCYKIGDVGFNKNIQLFKGNYCPVGWLKYSGF